MASEATPLFLHNPTEGDKLLLLDEVEEGLYLPGRWKATLEACVAKVFWDGFLWERFAFLSVRRAHEGPTTLGFAVLTGETATRRLHATPR
jgi:hypothetical protein